MMNIRGMTVRGIHPNNPIFSPEMEGMVIYPNHENPGWRRVRLKGAAWNEFIGVHQDHMEYLVNGEWVRS